MSTFSLFVGFIASLLLGLLLHWALGVALAAFFLAHRAAFARAEGSPEPAPVPCDAAVTGPRRSAAT